MLVGPKPLLGMLPDNGFEAIPAGLHDLAIGRARRESKEIKAVPNSRRLAGLR